MLSKMAVAKLALLATAHATTSSVELDGPAAKIVLNNGETDQLIVDAAFLRTLSSDVASLKTSVATLIAEVATLKTDMNAAKSDITAAEADITTAKADITTAKADITTAKADITSAESSIVTVQTDAGKALGHYPRYCRGPAAGLETFRPIFRLKKMVSGGTRHYGRIWASCSENSGSQPFEMNFFYVDRSNGQHGDFKNFAVYNPNMGGEILHTHSADVTWKMDWIDGIVNNGVEISFKRNTWETGRTCCIEEITYNHLDQGSGSKYWEYA